jgi:hypothetical protein
MVRHILDIDTTENFATVEIYVFINNFPYNVTHVDVWIIGGGSVIVPCNKYGNGFYQGKTNQTQWFLEGSGETFPFDSYNICLKIYDVTFIGKNFSLSSNTEDHQAFFDGLKYQSLLGAWKTLGPGTPLIPIANLSQNEVKFVLKRSFGICS